MIKHARIQTRAIPAPFWKRAAAYLIDIIILDLVIAFPFQDHFRKYETLNIKELLIGAADQTIGTIALFIGILSLAYWTILEYKVHQSIGKMLLNISVAPSHLTFGQALLRNSTKIFQVILLIDVAYMFFKRNHRRLFEVFSRTEVVEYTWNLH